VGAVLVALIGWSTVALREEGHRGVWNAGLIVSSLACALAVVYVAERPRHVAATLLSSDLLVDIGRRSYALYLWSYVLNTWLRDTGPYESILVLVTSFLAAEISYRLVELPALRFKHHFSTVEPVPAIELGLERSLLVLSDGRPG
jgi:peptidoglycan/LPS O-acetylase OafA/YrhL